jgi:hypothetical protein
MTPNEVKAAASGLSDQTFAQVLNEWRTFYEARLAAAGKTTPTWDNIFTPPGTPTSGDLTRITSDIRRALQANKLEAANDPTGACVYKVNGNPVCQEMTESECGAIHGSFQDGQTCPVTR